MSTARAALLVALAASTGCAENAILELTVMLPDSSSSLGGVPVQSVALRFDSDTRDFDSIWSGQADFVAALQPEVSTETLSVIVDGERIEQELAVRVEYCRDLAGCDGGETPLTERFVVFERAFYRGRFTSYALDLSSPPEPPPGAPTEIGVCAVRGCRDGDAVDWCEGGVHVCEL